MRGERPGEIGSGGGKNETERRRTGGDTNQLEEFFFFGDQTFFNQTRLHLEVEAAERKEGVKKN